MNRDKTTLRLVALGMVACILTISGVVVLDVALSWLRPDQFVGSPRTHLPTEIWMVFAALIGALGSYLAQGIRTQRAPETCEHPDCPSHTTPVVPTEGSTQ